MTDKPQIVGEEELERRVRAAIEQATTSHRHIHAANTYCLGCVEKSTRAVMRVLKRDRWRLR